MANVTTPTNKGSPSWIHSMPGKRRNAYHSTRSAAIEDRAKNQRIKPTTVKLDKMILRLSMCLTFLPQNASLFKQMSESKPIKIYTFLSRKRLKQPRTFGALFLGMWATASAVPIMDRSVPACRVQNPLSVSVRGHAGCLIRIGDKILMPKHKKSGTWNLPGGTTEPNETAPCTAHRETWEETGFDV